MTSKLEGRVALISGISTGLGRAGALLFAAEGASVVGLDIDADGAAVTVAEIIAGGGTGAVIHGDVTASADVQRSVRYAVDCFDKLDLLWANAGIGIFKDVVDTTESEWDRIVGVNLKGAYLMAHFGIPELRRWWRHHGAHGVDERRGGLAAMGRVLRHEGRHAHAVPSDGSRPCP